MSGVHHGLRPRSIVEARHTWPLIADGVDKLERLVLAKGDERIADGGIARTARPHPEFTGHGQRSKARAVAFAVLQLVPFSRRKFERGVASVQLHIIKAARALIASARQLRAFQHARRAIFKGPATSP